MAIGKVGINQFYCWNCFVEFSISSDKVKVFELAEDGSLLSFSGSESESTPELV